MKAVLTILFVLFLSVSAQANTGKSVNNFNPQIESYVETTFDKVDSILDGSNGSTTDTSKIEENNEKSVARLYKFKNSRIKKALAFTTKRNKAKMA